MATAAAPHSDTGASAENPGSRPRRPRDGTVEIIAGDGELGYVDGEALSARLWDCYGVCEWDGALVLCDTDNHRVRILRAGAMTTLAGGGPTGEDNGSFADGTGDAARFNRPSGAAVDSLGRLLVADERNHRLRLVSREGETTTYAGTGEQGHRDGPIATATFSGPDCVVVVPDGTVFVSELHCIRAI